LKRLKLIDAFIKTDTYELIVIGVSAGGMNALTYIVSQIPAHFSVPIVIVQHRHVNSNDFFSEHLNAHCEITVKESYDKDPIMPETIYVAPRNYHVQVERNGKLSLSTEGNVVYSRPSIDVLFLSAADAYQEKLIGIVLTGANSDGTAGLARIKELGGYCIVQEPEDAYVSHMPQSAVDNVSVDAVLSLKDIARLLFK